ncbi:patatin-like phospholipase family protein [Pedobacter agri]|uniref:patatin-like phospholipase family protein n=1 Tax=Pedobacter agri TaxID=454586 RepID=UPI00278260F0|nr:patatin-like phospholipase family protein [Pedobacter agri]MDQ1138626.1 hypothetical protein [Pedobacter agri]
MEIENLFSTNPGTSGEITGKQPVADQLQPAMLETPFKKIALALSGGGFRAAAYSLGTMSYLHHLPYPNSEKHEATVLDNVEFIASASGGSFAAILYSMQVQLKLPFEQTYKELLEFLNGQVLLEGVLGRINDPGEWKSDGSKNLINAFASIYDEKLFKRKTFGIYRDPEVAGGRRLEVCFNATEFHRGISFRFQASNVAADKAKIGNKYVYFDAFDEKAMETAGKIKLADILAASSCFPAGFEPIMFPDDFAYKGIGDQGELTTAELRKALTVTDYNNQPRQDAVDIGLMDGGINDNQGLYSTLLADRRRRQKKPSDGFDLIFISDVASYFMDAYKAPKQSDQGDIRQSSVNGLLERPLKSFLPKKIRGITGWAWLGLLLTLAIVITYFCSNHLTVRNCAIGAGSVTGSLTIILILLKMFLFNKPLKNFLSKFFRLGNESLVPILKGQIQGLQNFTDEAIGKLVSYIRNAPIGKLEQMGQTRLNSMLSLVMDINLKQTRRLIFDAFYGEFYGVDVWQNRRVFNVIYELSEKNTVNRKAVLETKFYKTYGFGQQTDENVWARDCIEVLTSNCEALNVIAEKARTMGTTLWTDQKDLDEHRIMDVVCAGQFTTCAKLLEYCMVVERILDNGVKNPNHPIQIAFDEKELEIFQGLRTKIQLDWDEFKNDPYFLYKESLKSKQN